MLCRRSPFGFDALFLHETLHNDNFYTANFEMQTPGPYPEAFAVFYRVMPAIGQVCLLIA